MTEALHRDEVIAMPERLGSEDGYNADIGEGDFAVAGLKYLRALDKRQSGKV